MTATQTQLRRGTSAQCDAMTPAEGEAIVDLTNDRLRLGDGLLAGGVVIPNAYDLQKRSFDAGAAGGTANALTLTLSPAPTGYTTNMAVTFKATAANTGATTININSLGAKDINKVSGSSIVSLASGDLVNGAYYTAWYDGVKFIIAGSIGSSTLTGSNGVTVSGSDVSLNTNNALGVGSIAILGLIVNSPTVAAGATVTITSLYWIFGRFTNTGGNSTGGVFFTTDFVPAGQVWRNIGGTSVGINQGGLFMRVS